MKRVFRGDRLKNIIDKLVLLNTVFWAVWTFIVWIVNNFSFELIVFNVSVLILPPIIFWHGGRWLFNYIFPKEEEK